MNKFLQRLQIVSLVFSYHLVFTMDSPLASPRGRLDNSPVSPRKKIDRDCVRTFQLFNPEKAGQLGIPLDAIMPQNFIITPDEKGVVFALGNGQVTFRSIVGLDSGIELIADGGNAKGAAMIAAGCRKKHDEIVVCFAINHTKIIFYDGVETKKFVARFEVWKKNSGNRDALFVQERMKRLEHAIQDIGINAAGAHTMATIEFQRPFLQQNRSSLVIYDLETNQTNASWSHEGAWWSHLVIDNDGNLVACSDIKGAVWIFEVKKGDTGMVLSAPTIIETKDTISRLNYPSKIMMWYVTDKHELKMLDVRKSLGVIEVARCITPISFEGILPGHSMVVMEKSPKLSVAYWSLDPEDDGKINIFFRREKDIFCQEENLQEMNCDMGYLLDSNFSYKNNSGQRVVEKGGICAVDVRGNLLVAITKGGKIRIFKLTERCGLIIRGRSKSEGEISRHSGNKVTKTSKKTDGLDIREKTISAEAVCRIDSPEPKRARIKSFPLPRRAVKTIATESGGTCEEKRSRKFSVSESHQDKSTQKGQSPEFQRALQQDILSDFGVKKTPDHKDEGPQKKK